MDESNPTTTDGIADNSDQYGGDLGDGNTTPLDWFQSGVKDLQSLAGSAASVITAINGTKLVPQSGTLQPIKQGGAIEQQNTKASWVHSIPGWAYFALGGVFLVGVLAIFWPKHRRA